VSLCMAGLNSLIGVDMKETIILKPNTWIIILGGDCPLGLARDFLLRSYNDAAGIICADSGANHAYELGITPDLIVGDGDSTRPEVLDYYQKRDVRMISYPIAKNFSDGEGAILEAIGRGAKNLAVFGAFGGRIDFQLGNVFSFVPHLPQLDDVVLYGEDFRAFYICSEATINGKPGDMVSLISLSPTVNNIYIENFIYPLNNDQLPFGSMWGVSNVLNKKEGKVKHSGGVLLAIHYYR